MNDYHIKDNEFTKKISKLNADLIDETILYEKSRIEESDEMQHFRKIDDSKVHLHKELEISEQKDMTSKYELSELQRLHVELMSELELMNNKNNDLVNPFIKSLQQQIIDLNELLNTSDEQLNNDNNIKNNLIIRLKELKQLNDEKYELLNSKKENLKSNELEPIRIERQMDSITKALVSLDNEKLILMNKLNSLENDLIGQTNSQIDANKFKQTLTEKLELNHKIIEQRNDEISSMLMNLNQLKSNSHELIIKKVEINTKRKEIEINLRHIIDKYNFLKKEYENMKRILKKKRLMIDSIKEVLPKLNEQLNDQTVIGNNQKEENERLNKLIIVLKETIDINMEQFLQNEGIEGSKKKVS